MTTELNLPPGGWRSPDDTAPTVALVRRMVALQAWADVSPHWQAAQAEALIDEVAVLLRDRASGSAEQHRAVFDEITMCAPGPTFPWEKVQPLARGLAFLYQFAPWADSGAVVASKRMRERGDVVDVISCSGANRRRIDPTIALVGAPYVGKLIHLDLLQAWASWPEVRAFCAEGLKAAEALGGSRTHLYTRAMWPPSHFAGALYKLRHPEVPWVAEFSDPLSIDIEGNWRPDPEVPREDWYDPVWRAIEERWGPVPERRRGFFPFAEWVAYALADEVWFTNEHQRELMLAVIDDDALREDVRRRSHVSHHPTLPPEFYELVPTEYTVDDSKLNLAYFGEFYATRGIGDVTSAIRLLPDELRSQIHLHVFTNFVPAGHGGRRPAHMTEAAYNELVNRAVQGVGADGIEDQVFINPARPFLEFLNLTQRFDYLIVCDALTAGHHERNPYLPSKWSDYANSAAGTWALVEEGSMLSTKPASAMSPVGDPEAAAVVLRQLLAKREARP